MKALDQRLPVRSSGEQLTQCLDFHVLDHFGGGDNLISAACLNHVVSGEEIDDV